MIPLYDRDGRAVAWTKGSLIYDAHGKPVAVLDGDLVFNLGGVYLGNADCGIYRDQAGHAVAFEPGAVGGPELPECRAAGPPPRPEPMTRLAGVPSRPPAPPAGTREWGLTWEEFLTGDFH